MVRWERSWSGRFSAINALILGLIQDARFLREPRAAERAQATWRRLLETYKK